MKQVIKYAYFMKRHILCNSMSTQLQDLSRTKEFKGYKLKQIGKEFDIMSKKRVLIDGFTKAIKSRFTDLNDDFKPTVISSLQNWPQENTEGLF